MVKIVLLMTFFLITTVCAFDKVTLKIENNIGKNQYFQTLIFNEKKTQLATNSNLFCGPSEKIWLGAFEKEATPNEKNHAGIIEQYLLRKKGQTPEKQSRGERVYINEELIGKSESIKETVKSYLAQACDLSSWLKLKVAEISMVSHNKRWFFALSFYENNQFQKMIEIPFEKVQCRSVGHTKMDNKVLDCDIEQFGLARIIAPKLFQ